MRTCSGCGETDQAAFSELSGKCRPCMVAYVTRRRAAIAQLKQGKACVDCERTYDYWQLDFDHTGTDKLLSVSTMRSFAWPRLLAEIAKCDLVCANCHRTRTYRRAELAGGIARPGRDRPAQLALDDLPNGSGQKD